MHKIKKHLYGSTITPGAPSYPLNGNYAFLGVADFVNYPATALGGVMETTGNSGITRGIGAGIRTLGGLLTSNIGNEIYKSALANSGKLTSQGLKGAFSTGLKNTFSGSAGLGFGMGAAGTVLSAIAGPKSEYEGLKGGTTQALDTAYDGIATGLSFIPGVGQVVGGAMSLAKGVGNVLGSLGGGTDGMTDVDAVLGSSFFNWNVGAINGFGGKRTHKLDNLDFMNLNKLDLMWSGYADALHDNLNARTKSGKKYGMFSSGARRRANKLIDTANMNQEYLLDMQRGTELGSIRGNNMASINSIRYNQALYGGVKPVAIGKQGLKISDVRNIINNYHNNKPTLSSISPVKPTIDIFLNGGKPENRESDNTTISLEDFINQKIQERTEAAIKKATTRKTGYKFKNKSWKNCIATATDNYGVPIVLRNSDLAADPKKYGFEELLFGDNTDTLPDGVLILDYNKPNDYTTPGHTIMLVGRTETGAPIYSYSSGSSDPKDMHNSTTNYFFDKWDDKVKPRAYRYIGTPAERAAWEEEYKAMYPEVKAFKQGGQMNLIPEGSLHARLHHMEDADGLTKKGIPVVDNDGNQLAEIEVNEIIFRKEVTDKLEELAKDGSNKAAEEAGRLLVKEIFENTDDRTGLIEEVTGKTEKFGDGGSLLFSLSPNTEITTKDLLELQKKIDLSQLGAYNLALANTNKTLLGLKTIGDSIANIPEQIQLANKDKKKLTDLAFSLKLMDSKYFEELKKLLDLAIALLESDLKALKELYNPQLAAEGEKLPENTFNGADVIRDILSLSPEKLLELLNILKYLKNND